MSTDRELLKLAANAAGFKWIDDCPENQGGLTVQSAQGEGVYNHHWNPLTDDGQALRLAVQLEIRASVSGTKAIVDWWQRPAMTELDNEVVPVDGDACKALRRAIVLAAAEIGKANP